MAAVWLDVTRCTGCGACVEVCPTAPHASLLATVVAAGTHLAIQAAPLVRQAVEHLLLRPRGMSAGLGRALTSTGRLLGAGRQLRHRQWGRR